MSLKPVVVVIPQRTLRFLSETRLGSTGCPPVLVARRQEAPQPRSADRTEEEDEGEEEGGASGEECSRFDDVTNVAPSRSVKHKAVEQRRKKKISEAIQQLLDVLTPPSPIGKMTRAEILERAVSQIDTLKEENEALKSKIDALPEPGGESELYGELLKQTVEFLTLKSQLQKHIERKQMSYDQTNESQYHDSIQHETVGDDRSEEAPPSTNPSRSTVLASPSLTSSNTTRNTFSSVGVLTTAVKPPVNSGHPSQSSARNGSSAIATESPPISQDASPTHQPWPVTSILSQVSHCQHTSFHGNSLRTGRVQSSPATVKHLPIHLSLPVSSISELAPPTSCHHSRSSRIVTNATNAGSIISTSGSGTQRNNLRLRTSHNVTSFTTGVRCESEVRSTHDSRHLQYHHPQYHTQRLQQRELQRDGYHGYTPPSAGEYSTALQSNTSSIVQPWVESHQRPRLHHMTKTTPRMSSSHYPLHHHQHELQQHSGHCSTRSHSGRFMPYPSSAGRTNHHNTSTFSPGSWSHDNHVISAGSSISSGGIGQNIAPLGRSYASGYSPHEHHHQQHFTPQLGGSNSLEYSNNYSSGQGHLPPFCQTQRSSGGRSSNVMSHDSTTTPPYPIQPHPHTGSNSSGAVWRPYSERSRSSGFYLSDILSLPSETEAPPLHLESTPPTGHRGMQSFLVNRLLEDI